MQITLKQQEIEVAILQYVAKQGVTVTPNSAVQMTAGRGENGITADIDLDTGTVNIASKAIVPASAGDTPKEVDLPAGAVDKPKGLFGDSGAVDS